MMEIVWLIGFIGALALLAMLSLRFGADSRDDITVPPRPPLGTH